MGTLNKNCGPDFYEGFALGIGQLFRYIGLLIGRSRPAVAELGLMVQ